MGIFMACVSVQSVYSWGHGSRKRSLDHLELGLWVVLSYHMGAGNKLSPLQEQQVLLTAEASLQALLQKKLKIFIHLMSAFFPPEIHIFNV